MKLRKVLFVLIVAILVFDIILIVRHKRLHEKPPPSKSNSQELPYDSVDCDNANGNPDLCTVEPDEPPAPKPAGERKL